MATPEAEPTVVAVPIALDLKAVVARDELREAGQEMENSDNIAFSIFASVNDVDTTKEMVSISRLADAV